MHLARSRADPGFKQRGAAGGPKLIAFTSEQAHYSYLKAAVLIGLGSDNLIIVPCDANGAMSAAGDNYLLAIQMCSMLFYPQRLCLLSLTSDIQPLLWVSMGISEQHTARQDTLLFKVV